MSDEQLKRDIPSGRARRIIRRAVERTHKFVSGVWYRKPSVHVSTELRSKSEYISHFLKSAPPEPPENSGETDQREEWLHEAHKLALDIRKFEIELYWKRASYFWTILGVAFAGFVALANQGTHPRLVFLVACIGVVLSTGWYFVNRGSKYWQENWERHVDVLEDAFVGPLYKTTLAREEFRWRWLLQGYPYSVSRINQLISLFVGMIWIGLAIITFPEANFVQQYRTASSWALGIATSFFVLLLGTLGKTRSEGRPRPVNFRVSSLGTTKAADEAGVPSSSNH